jgi:hypothetical protein
MASTLTHVPTVASMKLHIHNHVPSGFASLVATMATRTIDTMIIRIVTEKIPPRIILRRIGILTFHNSAIGRLITVW